MKKSSWGMNIEKMGKLVESLKTKPTLQVGVFQAKTARKQTGLTNASLGAIHEYGAPEHGLPARSFLRMPIGSHAKEIMASAKGRADMLLKAGGVKKLWDMVGQAAENVVDQAFETGGFGRWAPDSYKTLMWKLNKGKFRNLHRRKLTIAHIFAGNIGMGILIASHQLRQAVSHRVKMEF